MNRVLVTGATGNTGREVLRALNEREIPCNAAARSVAKVTDTFGTAVEAVEFDFVNPATWRKALKECSGVFLLRPPAISKVKSTLNPFIDIAHEEGVKYIIFLSVAGADTNRFIPHHQVEQHLISRSAPYTILRPGFFAQNFQDAYRQDIREANRICVPAGSGKMAFIDLFDVAEVAAEAFCNSQQHARKAYTLTGPEAISFQQAAEILSASLGRLIQYQPLSIPGYIRHLRRRSLGWGQTIIQTILHVGLRFGQAAEVDPTLEKLLGRPGRTLKTYVEEHGHIWTP